MELGPRSLDVSPSPSFPLSLPCAGTCTLSAHSSPPPPVIPKPWLASGLNGSISVATGEGNSLLESYSLDLAVTGVRAWAWAALTGQPSGPLKSDRVSQ